MTRRRAVLLSLLAIALALAAMFVHNITRLNALSLPLTRLSISRNMTTSSGLSARPVIVVGSGLAGLSAAHTALAHGARVHLLDRAAKPGGNSIKASSGINGAGTRFQTAQGITNDSVAQFTDDTVRSAGGRYTSPTPGVDRAALVAKLAAESAGSVTWLADEIGVDLAVVAQLGGHTVARTHRGHGKPPGAAIVQGLLEKLKADEGFTLSHEAEVTRLLTADGAVRGVAYTHEGVEHKLEGNVVFASGGFAGDAKLLAEHRPDFADLPSTNDARPGAHALLTAVGAPLLDMDSVQIHPSGFVDPANPDARVKFLAGEMLRGEGGILLHNGKRFVNELDTRLAVSNAIRALPPTDESPVRQWDITILLDPGAAEAAKSHLSFYEWKGLVKRVPVRSLPAETIAAIDAYAEAVSSGVKDPFGRPSYGRWNLVAGEANRDQEVFVGRLTPVVHFTMGGVAIDTEARVLRRAEGGGDALEPVPGLWAAGEVTGGVHGDNRLGGSSLLECVVFGRSAGAGAAAAGKS